jgi:hypothetical protein
MSTATPEKQIGRNEPCPCGSGKKYKRCHGVGAAPLVTPPKNEMALPGLGATGGAGTPGLPGMGGFDPSQMDPQWMMQFSQALQRLPRGQMQRLQAIMQKAMSGKDITREAQEFEKTLPVELQSLMSSFKMPGIAGGGNEALPMSGALAEPEAMMDADEARKIVEAAAAEGKISPEQAQALLAETQAAAGEATESAEAGALSEEKKGSRFSKLWRSVTGK